MLGEVRPAAVVGIAAVLMMAAGCTSPAIRDSFKVQGHQLSVVCGGSGSPTVVLIHGLTVPQGTFHEVRARRESSRGEYRAAAIGARRGSPT